MEKEYYYMFSSGQYSDYCVGGMCKSKEKLGEEYFAKHLKLMLLEQVKSWPEAVEYISNLKDDIGVLSNTMLQQDLFEIELERPMWRDAVNYRAWYEAYSKWEKETGKINQDFIGDLVSKGILEEVEYEEIWNG